MQLSSRIELRLPSILAEEARRQADGWGMTLSEFARHAIRTTLSSTDGPVTKPTQCSCENRGGRHEVL